MIARSHVLAPVAIYKGTVLEYQLRASSGYEVLDREVQAMLERAQPLPSMPEDMRQARLELVLPVQFQLR